METKVIELKINTNLDQTNSDVSKLKTNLKSAEGGAKDFDKAIAGKKSASFGELKDTIGGLVPGFDKASSGASMFNKQLLVLVANPIGLVVAAVVLAIAGLVAIFRTFQPVVDKVEQSVAALGAVMNVIKNTFLAVFTGTKSLGEAFSGLGGEMKTAAKRTMELVKAQQDLEDVLATQEVQTSRNRAEINKLNVQAKNRSLTEEQRLKLLQKAGDLENQDFLQRRKNADESVRQAREAIAIKAGFSAKEIKLLKEQGLAAKELAESKGGNFDEEFKQLSNAQKNRIGLEDESTANLEKNQNKQDALFDKQEAKKEKAASDATARNEKVEADRVKRNEKNANDEKIDQEKKKIEGQKVIDKINSDAQNFLDEKELKRKSLEDISAMVDGIENNNLIKAKANADAQALIAQKLADAKIQNLQRGSAMLSQISDLVGKNTAAGKAAAVASATIDTYSAAQSAFKNAQLNPISIIGPAYPYISAGLAIAGGLKNVKSILSVKTPGGDSGSAPSGGGSQAQSAPAFNVVGTSGQNQIAQTLNREQAPVKAYVVANDVTTQQGLTRNIVQAASVG